MAYYPPVRANYRWLFLVLGLIVEKIHSLRGEYVTSGWL